MNRAAYARDYQARVYQKGERPIKDHDAMVHPGSAAAKALPDKRLYAVPIIDTFLRALTEYYDKDAVAPGIVVAWLPERKIFYCSVRRYASHTFALTSNVLVSARSRHSSEQAVKTAMKVWKRTILQPQQENLDFIMKTIPTDDLRAEYDYQEHWEARER